MDDKPTKGEVWVNGVSSNTASGREISRLRRRLGIVFQDFRLLEDRSAEANVRFALEVTGAPKATIRAKVARVLTQVGSLSKTTNFRRELSGGEQQRVRSRAHWSTIRSFSSPTSPPETWTSAQLAACSSFCATSTRRERP